MSLILQALRACLLHETDTDQSLHYHVKRIEQNGGVYLSGSISKSSKEGMVIDTSTTIEATTDEQTSPLTEALSFLSFSDFKRTKKTSKQATAARTQAKQEREDCTRRFADDFKEATRVITDRAMKQLDKLSAGSIKNTN